MNVNVATTKLMILIAVPVALLLALIISMALRAGTADAMSSERAAAKKCGTVVVQFVPEGSGGAHNIRAEGIRCKPARRVARSCVDFADDDQALEGWTVVNWAGGRTLMTKGDRRISYLPVGGGGCGEFTQYCDDFSYRSVGFFNPKVVGVTCRMGRTKAKTWYDRGAGACGFGETCRIGVYRCRGNPKTATVTCLRKENGYRFTWQMGE